MRIFYILILCLLSGCLDGTLARIKRLRDNVILIDYVNIHHYVGDTIIKDNVKFVILSMEEKGRSDTTFLK